MVEMLCGVPGTADAFLQTAETTKSPILVSANAFWNDRKQRFQGHSKLWELEVPVALDCGGFVAMQRYGGYRWKMADYVEMATEMRPLWWAAMDYCCEPEIASAQEEITRRVRMTVFSLAETYAHVICWNHHLPGYQATAPMPVLQGWKPSDYEECASLMDAHVFSDAALAEIGVAGWPELIGIGSVCRRDLRGPNGIIKILDKVDSMLPAHVKLHLFGVKSQAAKALKDHPRVRSCDSMAWNLAARWEAYRTNVPKTQANLAKHMLGWIERQRDMCRPEPQMALCI